MTSSIFTVSATGGFIDPAGNSWSMRGLNATPQDCIIWSNPDTVLAQYPGLTCIRLNCNTGSDTDADIDDTVKAYTARGVVVQIEDHGGNQANLAWYTKMATLYKSNPYVFLETPNEPQAAAAQTAQNQIAVINAIRAPVSPTRSACSRLAATTARTFPPSYRPSAQTRSSPRHTSTTTTRTIQTMPPPRSPTGSPTTRRSASSAPSTNSATTPATATRWPPRATPSSLP